MCPAVETVDPAWSLPMLPPGRQYYLIYSEVAMRRVRNRVLLVSSVISLLSPVALSAPQDRHTTLLSPGLLPNCWDNSGPPVPDGFLGTWFPRAGRLSQRGQDRFCIQRGRPCIICFGLAYFSSKALSFFYFIYCVWEKPLIRSW